MGLGTRLGGLVVGWVVVVGAVSAFAAAPPPETLKLQDLAARSDRWPDKITLKKDMRFADGAAVKAGQQVTILDYNGGAIGVDAGNNLLFEVDAADTDLLEAANAAWAKLTPEQRAVDLKTVQADSSLWPEKVKCMGAFTLDSGKDIPPGQEFEFMSIDGQFAWVWAAEDKAKLRTELTQTDIVKRARALAAVEKEKRPSRIARAMAGKLIGADGKPVAKENLEQATVFGLYYGASWCGPCRQFSPGLVKYFNEVTAANPKLVIVLMSNDEKDPDMLGYMKEEKMPFPALPMKAWFTAPALTGYVKGEIPQFAIVDRNGKLIADCYQNGRYMGPKLPMAMLKKQVEAGAAK